MTNPESRKKSEKEKPLREKIQIAPCPFCGSEAVLTATRLRDGSAERHFVVCADMGCACALTFRNTPNQALLQWNRRVINLRLVENKQLNNTTKL